MLIGIGTGVSFGQRKKKGSPNFEPQNPPVTTKKYLFMDGVDDTLRTPPLTVDSVELEFLCLSTQNISVAYNYLVEIRPDFELIRNEANKTFRFKTNIKSYEINGNVYQVSGGYQTAQGIVYDIKQKIKLILSVKTTEIVSLFCRSASASSLTAGNIYSVKLFNGTTLIAHYDMSTGTVQDQSGNGNHALLEGGAWMEESI